MNYRRYQVENCSRSRSFAFSRIYVRSIHAMAILLSQWPTPQGIRAVVIVTSTSSDQSLPRCFQFAKSVMRYAMKIISRKCNWQNGGNFEIIACFVWTPFPLTQPVTKSWSNSVEFSREIRPTWYPRTALERCELEDITLLFWTRGLWRVASTMATQFDGGRPLQARHTPSMCSSLGALLFLWNFGAKSVTITLHALEFHNGFIFKLQIILVFLS